MSSPERSSPERSSRLRAGIVALLLLAAGLVAVAGPPAASAATCPCSIWSSTAAPANPAAGDSSAVEVGVKVRPDTSGYVTALRFYKGTGNGGTHVGSLWSTSGTRLASATFTGETATGWQQVALSAPVAVTAGTTYVASYYAPQGHYAADNGAFATAGVDNAPLHALADGVSGGDGVYAYGTGGGFPTSTYQSTNYWVDVVFSTTATDTTPPTLVSRTPAAGATGVPVGTAAGGTFSEDVTGAQVALTRSGTAVAGSTAYTSASRTVTFTPSAPLATSTTYSVAVSGAKDAAGNVMATDSWTFTTAATAGGCPCSLWPSSATPATASQADSSAVEVGTRFSSSTSGYVTALRFYKGTANTGTHVGHLWTASGTLLATATYSGETASGWQQVSLPSPVAVTAGSSYVTSYYAPAGRYAVTGSYFTTARTNGPLTAAADSTATPDGAYRYGGGFPTSSFKATSYWVDVVFDTTATDTVPPTVTSRTPASGATGVDVATTATATFSEAVSSASLAFSLASAPGTAVAGTTSYDAPTRTATFTPSAALAAGTGYTATVTASDLAGNAMTAPVTWSFTTGTPVGSAPGGPVLVVTPSGTSFGGYLPEILKAEGLNAYARSDLSALTASGLAPYDVVLLAQTPLTSAQVSALTTWVNGGGHLVAMRPDQQLAGLLGLAPVTSGATTLSDGYLQVDTSAGPGAGITDQSIQFHGTADRYALSGATAVAALWSGPSTATSNPAVTVRTVGTQGGRAAAFTYDLARSVVYTRQGNPAWAGQERDGQPPIRADDLFWGSTSTNGYLNLDKVAIPQADEQQRLLVNVIESINQDRKPLPRFWYFPRMLKAVVVGTGDDHGNGGTAGRFDEYLANSTPGCSVVQWACLRSTSYVYTSTPLTDSQALSYTNQGFEVGLHPQNGCTDFTASSLENDYTTQLAAWQAKYTSEPAPTTSRYHCLVWSDWLTQAQTEARHGIGLDTNYYYWPPTWINDRPGFMTGSGIPMRFAGTTGSVLDVFQAATQMTDESGQSYPATPDTLLGNALGPLGYYGAFTANEHNDQATTYDSDQLIASAQAHGVPIVTARQMLTWLRGRDSSSFTGLTWSGTTLSFGVVAGAGADGLTALLPTSSPSGTLTALSRGGSSVPYTTQTLKGLQYAVFTATAGSYTATYGGTAALRAAVRVSAGSAARPTVVAGSAPSPAGVSALSLPDGTVTLTWTTAQAADSVVQVGPTGRPLSTARVDPSSVTQHSVVVTGLVPGKDYSYSVRSTDAVGRSGSSPTGRFVQSAAGVAQTTAPAFRTGTSDGGTLVASAGDGELQLQAAGTADFTQPRVPAAWSARRARVLGGVLRLDGGSVSGPLLAGAGRSVLAQATFTEAGQSLLLRGGAADPGTGFVEADGRLVARTVVAGRAVDAVLPGLLVGSPHLFGVTLGARGTSLTVDGRVVARAARPVTGPARLDAADATGDALALTVDWVRSAPDRKSSTYTSQVLDAQQQVRWQHAVWSADVPAGTALQVSVRTGSTPVPGWGWTGFHRLAGSGAAVGSSGRYLQYRLQLVTSDPTRTPVLEAIGFTHDGVPARCSGSEDCATSGAAGRASGPAPGGSAGGGTDRRAGWHLGLVLAACMAGAAGRRLPAIGRLRAVGAGG